jgi:NTP pyrophosphatase (non-canonical NTP hydrolase)
MSERSGTDLTLRALQRMILQMYGTKDAARGDLATYLWLAEEFGELATAVRAGSPAELASEMADVLAWIATLANIRGVDLESAVMDKYGQGCPGCKKVPCTCDPAEKP